MTVNRRPLIRRILHPTDFTQGSETAFIHGLRLTCAVRGTLSIVHVDRVRKHPDWDQYPSVRDTLARWNLLPADSSRSDVTSLGIHVGKSSVVDRDPARGILQYLESHEADLVVLATHQRHGLDRWLHTNVAGTISDQGDCATLFLPYGQSGFVDAESGNCRLRKILIPVVNEPSCRPALELAVALAQALMSEPCEICLLHVGDPAETPVVRLFDEPDVIWKRHNLEGPVVRTILQFAQDISADAIVMTTSGRHGFLDALRGSTTEQIIENSPCPVLATHAISRD